jgi:hypothetical protein
LAKIYEYHIGATILKAMIVEDLVLFKNKIIIFNYIENKK